MYMLTAFLLACVLGGIMFTVSWLVEHSGRGSYPEMWRAFLSLRTVR